MCGRFLLKSYNSGGKFFWQHWLLENPWCIVKFHIIDYFGVVLESLYTMSKSERSQTRDLRTEITTPMSCVWSLMHFRYWKHFALNLFHNNFFNTISRIHFLGLQSVKPSGFYPRWKIMDFIYGVYNPPPTHKCWKIIYKRNTFSFTFDRYLFC